MAANRPDNLSPEQEEGILALLTEPTVAKAAEKCGVSERALYYWLDEPAFEAAYCKARRKLFRQAMNVAQRYAPTALSVLVQISTDPQAPHGARVAAATNVAKFSRESIELDDVIQRLTALENAQRAGRN